MLCKYCRDKLVEGTITYLADEDNHIIAIRGVPCDLCERCGNELLALDVSERLVDMTKAILTRNEEVTVTTYDEMLKEI